MQERTVPRLAAISPARGAAAANASCDSTQPAAHVTICGPHRRVLCTRRMHELSIAMSLVDTICEELPKLGAVVVRAVHVRVGALSGVVPDALTFAFDVAADGSPIAGARLDVEGTPGRELELAALEVVDEPANC